MHYGRGTLLKEWYISLDAMTPEQWKTLCSVHNWAKIHQSALNNAQFVGGRPDEGNAYGYIGWDKNKAVLVARNTNVNTQKLIIPFDRTTGFYGTVNENYKANVVYPYRDSYPVVFQSGKNMEIEMPGYSTMVLEFEKGTPEIKNNLKQSLLDFKTTSVSEGNVKTTLKIPADIKNRCDLLLIGYNQVPLITINGKEIKADRSTKALLNNFAGYAIAGMPSIKAVDWKMESMNLLPYAGQTIEIIYKGKGKFESHVLFEQSIETKKIRNTE